MAGTVRTDKVQIVLGITTNEAQAELQKLARETSEASKGLKEMKKNSEEYAATSKLIRENTERMKSLQDAIGITGLSMGQLEKMSKSLHKELKDAIPDSAEWKNLSNRVQQVDGRLGDLKAQSKGVSKELLNMVPGFGAFDRGKTAITGAISAAKGFAGSMNIVKAALISTGLGAIVVAVGALVVWFAKTDTGAKILEGTMNALGNVFGVLTARISNLLQGDFKGAFSGLGDDLAKAAKSGYELAEAMDQIDDLRRQGELANAKDEVRLERLLIKMKNRTLSERERIDIAKQASELDQKIYDRKRELLEKEIAAEEKNIGQSIKAAQKGNDLKALSFKTLIRLALDGNKALAEGSLTDADKDKINELYIRRQTLAKEQISLEERISNRTDQLEQAAEEKRKARAEARQRELDKLEARRKAEADKAKAAAEKAAADELAITKQAAADEAAVIEDEYEKRIQIIRNAQQEQLRVIDASQATDETKARAKTALATKTEQEIFDIGLQRLDAETKAAEEQAEKEKQIALQKVAALARIQLAQAENSGDRQAILDARMKLVEALRDIEVNGTKQTEEGKREAILKADAELNNLRRANRNQDLQDLVAALEQSLSVISSFGSIILSNEQKEANRRLKLIDTEKNKRLQKLEDERKKGLITQEKYDAEKEKLDLEAQAKGDQIRKEQAEKQKVFSIFQVLSNLAIEIAKYYAEYQLIGTGFAIAAGARAAAQVAAIQAQEYEQGGIIELGGSRHRTAGRKTGVLMTDLATNRPLGIAEAGERMAIIRRDTNPATEMFLDMALLAQKGIIGPQFADGGVVAGREAAQVVVQDTGYQMVVAELRGLRQDLAALPDSIVLQVPITTIEKGLDKVKKIRTETAY